MCIWLTPALKDFQGHSETIYSNELNGLRMQTGRKDQLDMDKRKRSWVVEAEMTWNKLWSS